MKQAARELGQVAEIHLFPYSHHDYAWTNTREWHIKRYLQIFEENLDLMKSDPGYTFLVDNILHSLLPFLHYRPERFEELRARVQEGRIAFANGGMALVRPTCVGEETFIRNMAAGKRFLEQTFGLADIEMYANFDTACGHSQLPQLLALGGHRYYRFFRPEAALDHRGIPKQFRWKGLDGSDVLVSRGSYFGFHEGKFTNQDYEAEWEAIKAAFCEQELKDKLLLLPTDIVLLFYGSDDTRPLCNLVDEPIRLREFMEAWNKREASVMKFSTPKQYFALLEQKEVPTVEGVLDPCELIFLSTYKGDASFWKMRTLVDRLLVKAETYAAYAAMLGFDYPQAEIGRLWSDLFEYAGHAIEFIFEQDYERLYALAKTAETGARQLIRTTCEQLAGLAAPAASANSIAPADELRYVAFNSLNWHRKEPILLHITGPFGVSGFDIVDGSGNKLPYQIVNAFTGEKPYVSSPYSEVDVAVEVDVPAMGCATLAIVANGQQLEGKEAESEGGNEGEGGWAQAGAAVLPGPEKPIVVDNGVLQVIFKEGRIVGIRDHRTGHTADLSAGASTMGGIRFIHTKEVQHWDPSWEAIKEMPMAPESWALVENGPVRWRYRVTGSAGSEQISQDIVLARGESAIRFEVSLLCTGAEGYFTADFAADPGTPIQVDIPFGVEGRELGGESFSTLERGNPGQFYGKTWAAFRSSGMATAIVAEDTYIFYHHDTERDLIAHTLHRCMPLHNKAGWVQNIHPSLEGKGKHSFAYSLYVAAEEGKYGELAQYAKSRVHPLETAPVMYRAAGDGAGGGASLHRSFLSTNAEHVLISAFYKEGEDYIVRLYEAEGKPAALEIAFPVRLEEAERVDLLGNPAGEVRLAPRKAGGDGSGGPGGVSAVGSNGGDGGNSDGGDGDACCGAGGGDSNGSYGSYGSYGSGGSVIYADIRPWEIMTIRFRTSGMSAVRPEFAGRLTGRCIQ